MLRFLSAAACLLVLTLPVAAQQQEQSQSAPSDRQNASSAAQGKKAQPQPASRKKPSGEQNPFPEAQSEAAAQEEQQQKNATAPAASEPDAPKTKSSEANQNPFPEEQSQKAAQQNEDHGSSSGQDYSSSQTGLQGLDIPKNANKARVTEDPSLGKKDVEVGTFYLKTGDYKGAYGRFREATQLDPTNSDAVFGLAETARHLNLRDEAIRNYRLYLSALPDGPRAKEARKGLKDLGARPIPE